MVLLATFAQGLDGMLLCSQTPEDGSTSALFEDSGTSPIVQDSSSEFLFSFAICQSARVLKRIPHAARHLAASKFAVVLDDVTNFAGVVLPSHKVVIGGVWCLQ
jgi:hypothetical protein